MDPIARATVLDFHRHRIRVFGTGSVESLGWRDADSQRKRFEVIAATCDFAHAAVLDVGCGRGDLKAFLDARFEGVTYLGLDHMATFLDEARARYAQSPGTDFLQCDFSAVTLPTVDYVVASGALGYRCADPDYPVTMIRRMFDAARRAVVFNMLDADVFPDHPLLVGRDRATIVALCRGLAPAVEVIDGYLDDDFTICVRRAPGRAGMPSSTDSLEMLR